MQTIQLPNGTEMPILGYGVYRVAPQECEQCVLDALAAGYRHIDTAQAYYNEAEVGKAIRRSGIARDEIFLTSKVWIDRYGYKQTKASVEESLHKLQTDYIDLMLLHQPFGDVYGAWQALEELYQDGRVRAIGISNFYADRMVDLCLFGCEDFRTPEGKEVKGVRPMVNQVEIHPYHQQEELLQWLHRYHIVPEAWGPFVQGREDMAEDPVLKAIAEKHGKSLHQVVLRWHIQRGVIVFPMSRNPLHMADNMNIFDFALTEEEMKAIAALDKHHSAVFSHQDPTTVEFFAKLVKKQ